MSLRPAELPARCGLADVEKLGDHLANAKTVLAWLLGFVGAPDALVALLVPIRESGSLVPQLVIAGFVRRLPRRKLVWVAGSFLQAFAVLGIGLAAGSQTGLVAGWLIDKFGDLVGAPLKARTDLEPSLLDLKINITDVMHAIGAFTGEAYRWVATYQQGTAARRRDAGQVLVHRHTASREY